MQAGSIQCRTRQKKKRICIEKIYNRRTVGPPEKNSFPVASMVSRGSVKDMMERNEPRREEGKKASVHTLF